VPTTVDIVKTFSLFKERKRKRKKKRKKIAVEK
jgi:hypothetical protein